jgi:hypothetical protein
VSVGWAVSATGPAGNAPSLVAKEPAYAQRIGLLTLLVAEYDEAIAALARAQRLTYATRRGVLRTAKLASRENLRVTTSS